MSPNVKSLNDSIDAKPDDFKLTLSIFNKSTSNNMQRVKSAKQINPTSSDAYRQYLQ